MPGILALDPSIGGFGYAHAEPGATPTYGSARIVPVLPKGGDFGAHLEAIQDAVDIFLRARVDVFEPEWIVREQTFDGPDSRNNLILHRIGGQIDLRAKDWGIGCRQAEAQAVTKFFTGQGSFPGKTYAQRRAAKKRAVVARCHLLGWKVTDHNQADGCAILCYAEAKLFPEMRLSMKRPAGPLFMEKRRELG